jgi:dTMP kinase
VGSDGRGVFIVFEGIDGAGKTTQATLLQSRLAKLPGISSSMFHEPGGTPLGEEVERLVKQAELTPEGELLLFLASRAELVRTVIDPALARGEVVICDRFAGSTLAYQGYGRGLNLNDIEMVLELATGGLVPDLTILLNVPVKVGLARKRRERRPARERALQFTMFGTPEMLVGSEDRFHAEEAAFHERVRQGYLRMAEEEGPARWRLINGAGSRRAVSEAIWTVVKPLVRKT